MVIECFVVFTVLIVVSLLLRSIDAFNCLLFTRSLICLCLLFVCLFVYRRYSWELYL